MKLAQAPLGSKFLTCQVLQQTACCCLHIVSGGPASSWHVRNQYRHRRARVCCVDDDRQDSESHSKAPVVRAAKELNSNEREHRG